MESFVMVVAVKACAALVLALAVAALGRRIAPPALVHLLWVVVLLELFAPPVIEVGILPRLDAPGAPVVTAAVSPSASGLEGVPSVAAPAFGRYELLLLIWVGGALAFVTLAVVRLARFRKQIAGATDPPDEMLAGARELSARLGLSRCPRVRLVSARVSPMLLGRVGRPDLLFPEALLQHLDPSERDALLAHELAHVRRRDHWVRWLELAASAVFWWHPAVWWARRRLRREEEICCDALVVRCMPERARDYARGLLKTVEFLAGADRPLPALASGVGRADELKERLTMIVKNRTPRALKRTHLFLLAVGALATVLVLPTWADRGETPEDDGSPAAEQARTDLLRLERQAVELEQRLYEIRARQEELEHVLSHELELADPRDRDARLAELEAEAQRMHAEMEAREHESRRREAELERAVEELAAERMKQEVLRLREMGRQEAALKIERELAHVREMREQEQAERSHEIEQTIRAEIDRLRLQLDKLEAQGRTKEAAKVDLAIRELMIELERSLAY